MKFMKFAAPCMALLLAAAPTLRADTVTGSIWIVPVLATGSVPAPGDPLYSTTPTFTFTLTNASGSVFNMNSTNDPGLTGYTVNGWLTSGGDTVTYATGGGIAGTTFLDTPSTCHDASATLCTTSAVALFTGTISTPVAAGDTVFHDDGFILTVGGVTEASFPAKTDPEMNTLGALPAGTADIFYAEVSGAPAVLMTALPIGAPTVPEPSSIALFGTGLLAAAGAVRRRLVK